MAVEASSSVRCHPDSSTTELDGAQQPPETSFFVFPLQSSINDGADFKAVADAMKVIGFTGDEVQTVYKILATILHLVTKAKEHKDQTLFPLIPYFT